MGKLGLQKPADTLEETAPLIIYVLAHNVLLATNPWQGHPELLSVHNKPTYILSRFHGLGLSRSPYGSLITPECK
jgi:hypothetical protein